VVKAGEPGERIIGENMTRLGTRMGDGPLISEKNDTGRKITVAEENTYLLGWSQKETRDG